MHDILSHIPIRTDVFQGRSAPVVIGLAVCLATFAGCGRQGASIAEAQVNRAAAPGAPANAIAAPSDQAEATLDEPTEPSLLVEAPAADGVALADDNATQLLRERLGVPKQAELRPLFGLSGPHPRDNGAGELQKSAETRLTLADAPKTPVVLPLEQFKSPFVHAALDMPPLAFARDPIRPDVPKLLLGPRAYVASPDFSRPPHVARFARDPEPLVLPADDSTGAATQRVIASPLAIPAPVLPPPLALSIPDPFEHARAVELKTPPPDVDPPAVSFVRPVRPVLTPPPAKP